jgi:DMSO reductase family type II enzyme chaperone
MTPIERAEGYRLLATAFRHPAVARLASGREPADLRAELEDVADDPGPIGGLARALLDAGAVDLEAEYNRLFSQNAPVSPYETSYMMGDKGARLGQITAFYSAFGVRSGGGEREAPDHVGAELEFAALLSLKEALAMEQGLTEQLEIVRHARRILVEEHLGAWIPSFAERVLSHCEHPFYAAVATAAARFVTADLADHGWTGTNVAEKVSLPIVDDADPMTCTSE